MKVLVGNISKELVKMISYQLAMTPSALHISQFSDGESNIEIENSFYNEEVFILQSLSSPVNQHLIELLLIIDSVKRQDAKKITVIIPYYGYSRQDRMIKNNNMQSSVGAKLVAKLIQTAGAMCIAVIDLHAKQIEGFFDIPIINFHCYEMFCNTIQCNNLSVVAPDIGAIDRAREFASILDKRYASNIAHNIIVIDKNRQQAGTSQVMNVIGNVVNKNCVIIDDIVDSGGTLCNAAIALKKHGAQSVIACITHGVFSGDAMIKISSSLIDKLIITDTIIHTFEKTNKIEIISIASIITKIIQKER
ncbi:ribose-phosphate diphosphokinase [Wolbachia endosymbiont of Howardula sp.]|uniref:ribose-phosphate diphosphokinase n=1 Tax=Wolbachia endosymbiont of Howardula sp. TaxID=2916816 RepID=UPI00217EE17C|nr:ribose-phosphate diphosphokinase [Wolbachia endosymbiont of Howardula sp.]UWI83233.1 ribose-phosphate diphosphokinase [Wolbachia endosymbiont of Howardula sp.]